MSVVFVFFVFGLIVGSFLNVVVYRLKDAETILGRSFCRKCHHQIRWYDNIPLFSFLLLWAKCRDCGEKISWQYPLLEFLTAVCFALVGRYFFDIFNSGTWFETAWLLILISLLLVIAAYDLLYMEIPVSLLVAGAILTLLFLGLDTLNGFNSSFFSRQMQSLIGALTVGGLFFFLVFFSKETWMGWGDVWLGALSGAMVGFSNVLFMMTLSFGIGAIVGVGLMLIQKKDLKTQVPFAPYLVTGTILTIFLPEMFPVFSRLFLY